MRALALLLSLSVLPIAWAEDEVEHVKGISVYAGPDIFHDTVFSSPRVRARPRIGGEILLPDSFVLTGDFVFYSIGLPSSSIRRTRLNVGVSYAFLENRLEVGGVVSDTNTSYDKYGSTAALGYGIRAKYNLPIGEHVRLAAISGWDYEKQVTLTYDTGQPVTTSALANDLCYAFTLGLSKDCGTIQNQFTVPSSHQLFLSAVLEYLF